MRGEVHIADIVTELSRHSLLPCIVFRTSRNQCDVDAQHAQSSPDLHLAPPEQLALRNCVEEVLRRYEMDPELVKSHPQFPGLVQTGVGAHHAGQLLVWRLLLEELMQAGLLRVLVATGTVAAGVDFPARTVVITAHSRRGAEGFASLTAAEFQQMSGRAGRRGKDTVGFCLAAPAPFCDARTLLRIAKRPPEPLVSSYFPGPSTVLNLLRYRNVDDLRYTVTRSLAAFIDRKQGQGFVSEAEEIERSLPAELRSAAEEFEQLSKDQRKHLKRARRLRRQSEELANRQEALLESVFTGLRTLGCLEGTTLSQKGYWAAQLCTSVVLELAEIIEAGLLTDVSAERFTAIVASISGDEHRQYLDSKKTPLSKEDVQQIQGILDRVGATQMPGVSGGRKVLPSAAHTVVTWMHSTDWHEFRSLLALQGSAEGDAARLITQTAEQLQQITRLTETHLALALRAEEAKRRILRPPLTEVLNLDSM